MNSLVEVPRVLLVDDEVNVLNAILRVVRQLGWKVTAVNTGRKALEKMSEVAFDLIISDLKMPGMDGIELLSVMAELYPDTPRILLSGHASSLDVRAAIDRCEIEFFVPKPWDNDELKDLMIALVSRERRDVLVV